MAAGVHTSLYWGQFTPSDGKNYDPLTGVGDGVLGNDSTRLKPSVALSLVAAAAFGDSLLRARLTTPTTVISPAHIQPLNSYVGQQNYFGGMPIQPNVMLSVQNPLMLQAGNPITAEVQQMGHMTPTHPTPQYGGSASVLLWVCQQVEAVPAGEALWIQFSISTKQPDGSQKQNFVPGGSWVTVPNLVYEKASLQAGRYAIIGIHVHGEAWNSNGPVPVLAARLVIPGELMRPGAIVQADAGAIPPRMTTDASLGVLGKFDALNPPAIEVFVDNNPGDVTTYLQSFEGYLRIIKLA